MTHSARAPVITERQAQENAKRQAAEARRNAIFRASMQIPWATEGRYTDPNETIAVGYGSASVHTAERLGVISRDHSAGGWRRAFPSPEAEAEWIRKFGGEDA